MILPLYSFSSVAYYETLPGEGLLPDIETLTDTTQTIKLPAGDIIRPMVSDDLTSVCQLENVSQRHPWSQQHFIDELHNPVATVDLYFCKDQLAGFLCSWLIAGELQVQNLATLPAMRRRGIGARLLENLIKRSQKEGLHSICLEVRASNLAAIALYQRFGFVTVGTRSAYYADGEDALIMTFYENSNHTS